MSDVVTKRYMAMAEEPIHVGADRLSSIAGIARDVDGFPYIPASSLKGSVRALSAKLFSLEGCDGKGWHCPQPHKCASCSVFGFLNDHHGRKAASLVSFSAASLALVPIQTELGLVWVTTWNRLVTCGLLVQPPAHSESVWSLGESLFLDHAENIRRALKHSWSGEIRRLDTNSWPGPSAAQQAYRRTIVLDETSFSSLSCSFTGSAACVSLAGDTGRARDGGLFEIEHINRTSILGFKVSFQDPASRGVVEFLSGDCDHGNHIPATLEEISRIIDVGLQGLVQYGVGGKRSRGYGRITVWEVPSPSPSDMPLGFPSPPFTGRQPKVFISHSWTDKSVARRLATDLQAEYCDVWLDPK